jgi:GxxExxY protein
METRRFDLTQRILACAFDIHAQLGPGLLEGSYKACMLHRLSRDGLRVEAEVPIGIAFDGVRIETAYRADLVVDGRVLVELKSVERLMSIHIAQTLTYIRHAGLEVGLLLNFNVRSLRDGIRRVDNRFSIPAHSSDSPDSPLPAFDYLP